LIDSDMFINSSR